MREQEDGAVRKNGGEISGVCFEGLKNRIPELRRPTAHDTNPDIETESVLRFPNRIRDWKAQGVMPDCTAARQFWLRSMPSTGGRSNLKPHVAENARMEPLTDRERRRR